MNALARDLAAQDAREDVVGLVGRAAGDGHGSSSEVAPNSFHLKSI
jgi:hypothetical protein